MRHRALLALPLAAQLFLSTCAQASSTRHHIDLALDSSNRPRIVAFDDAASFVRLGLVDAFSTWNCYTLQDAPGMGGGLLDSGSEGVAVVDVGGIPYVAYPVFKRLSVENPGTCGVTQVDRIQLWLTKGTSVSASSQVCIDSTGSLEGCVNFSDQGAHVVLLRTSDGRVHAAYLQSGATTLRYAVSNTGVTSFTSEPVASAAHTNGGGDISLAIDSGGMPHIAFVQSGQYQYAVKSGQGWSSTTLAVPAYSVGYSGRRLTNVSLKLDGSGLASILFTVGDSLWCARETSSLSFATPELVDGTDVADGGYPHLARANDGTLHASYFRGVSGAEVLYHVQRGSSGWGTPVAVSATGLSAAPSQRQVIALTSGTSQLPRIAFPATDPAGGYGVWYAEFDGSAWTKSLVVPCSTTTGTGGGGGGGHSGDEEGALTYSRPPEEMGGDVIAMRSPAVLRAGAPIEFQIVTVGATSLDVKLLDVSGRLALHQTLEVHSGSTDLRVSPGKLRPGVYLVRVEVRHGAPRTFRIAVLH